MIKYEVIESVYDSDGELLGINSLGRFYTEEDAEAFQTDYVKNYYYSAFYDYYFKTLNSTNRSFFTLRPYKPSSEPKTTYEGISDSVKNLFKRKEPIQGPPGPIGLTGDKGFPGVGVTDSWKIKEDELIAIIQSAQESYDERNKEIAKIESQLDKVREELQEMKDYVAELEK